MRPTPIEAKSPASAAEKSAGSIKTETRIIIYGAGLYGERCAEKLINDGYRDNIAAVAVSHSGDNVTEVAGIKVREISELYIYRKAAIVLVACLPDTAEEIKRSLEKEQFEKIYSLF